MCGISSWSPTQAGSQAFVKGGGGLFWKVKTTVSDLDPNFPLLLNQIEAVFCPKPGDLQKKKVFTEIETNFSAEITNSNSFSGRIAATTSLLRLPNLFGGAVFIFWAKIGLKSTINVRFCMHFWPMGVLEPSPPPPPPFRLRYCACMLCLVRVNLFFILRKHLF